MRLPPGCAAAARLCVVAAAILLALAGRSAHAQGAPERILYLFQEQIGSSPQWFALSPLGYLSGRLHLVPSNGCFVNGSLRPGYVLGQGPGAITPLPIPNNCFDTLEEALAAAWPEVLRRYPPGRVLGVVDLRNPPDGLGRRLLDVFPAVYNVPQPFEPGKNVGGCAPQTEEPCAQSGDTPAAMTMNPVQIGTGNKYLRQSDYLSADAHPLMLMRHYNSANGARSPFGVGWSAAYFQRLQITTRINPSTAQPEAVIYAYRPSGRTNTFAVENGAWTAGRDVRITLSMASNGQFELRTEDDGVEVYDASGRLLAIRDRHHRVLTLAYGPDARLTSVTNAFGRTLAFAYDAQGRVTQVTDPAGGLYRYTFDEVGNLTSAVGPDNLARTYHYEHPSYRNALTGVTDEAGRRALVVAYDVYGRATVSERAGGVERTTLDYAGDGLSATVTDALGMARTYVFRSQFGSVKNSAVNAPCAHCGNVAASTTYDANGFVASQTDWNGVVTRYSYDARGLQTQRIEGEGTSAARTISTEWHPVLRLPTRIAEPKRMTINTYDADGTACGARGALCTRSVQATTDLTGAMGSAANTIGPIRRWTYTYDARGQRLTVDGPRDDVIDVATATYDAQGNVTAMSNALGHTTRVTASDAHGQPLAVVDPNGLVTTFVYDARRRLVQRSAGAEITRFAYDALGDLVRVTGPDGSSIDYTYDAARRLIGVQDGLGNRIVFTLDAMGNRVQEQVFDASGALTQSRTRVFDTLNRLAQEIGAAGQSTGYQYDAQGNLTVLTDPLGRVTQQSYDPLNRLLSNSDPAGGVTRYAYDGLDQLVAVTDARGLQTFYTRSGLGDLEVQSSPDTGTMLFAHDAAGNVISATDAKGQPTLTRYDALGRPLESVFADGRRHRFSYDAAGTAIGRLAAIEERDGANALVGATGYGYDLHGRLVAETRTLAGRNYTTAYSFDAAGRLRGIVYPSGRRFDYTLDALGRIESIGTVVAGQGVSLADAVRYQPFGGPRQATLANGSNFARAFDRDGRIAAYALAGETQVLGWDAADRLRSLARAGTTSTYAYDALDRLIGAVVPGGSWSYGYDAVGNRTVKTTPAAAETYSYASTSHRLQTIASTSGAARSFAYDANGSQISDTGKSFAYDARGRLVQATLPGGSARYEINAQGERVRKVASLGAIDTVYHYDRAGRLIGESTSAGQWLREYAWLGSTPIALIGAPGQAGPQCAPSPTPDTSESFAGFAPNERLEIRSGRPGAADWEAGLGPNTQSAGQFATGQINWVNGRAVRWTLTYTAGGSARLELGDGASTSTLAWSDASRPMRTGNAVSVWVKANPNVGLGTRIRVRVDSLDGSGIGETLESSGDNRGWEARRTYQSSSLADGFTMSGTVTLFFSGSAPPSGSRLNFTVSAGNVTCPSGASQASETLATIHADHLDTPRAVSNAQGQALWRWENTEPFGDAPAQEDPSGLGRFEFNLRFPGQYFDRETGTAYNYFRDYDPSIGRYVQSDPIGLLDGVNTYAYVGSRPLSLVDPLGLAKSDDAAITAAIARGDVQALETLLQAANPTQLALINQALQRLSSKASEIIARECRGSIHREFPSQMLERSLKEIMDSAKSGDATARKALKLLRDNRFKK